jgi:hypothetical protein
MGVIGNDCCFTFGQSFLYHVIALHSTESVTPHHGCGGKAGDAETHNKLI